MASSNNSNTGHPCVGRDPGGPSRGVQGKMVACSTAQQQNRARAICQNPQPASMHPARPERAAECAQSSGAGPREKQVARRPSGTVQVMCERVCKKSARRLLLAGNNSGHHKTRTRKQAQGASHESHGICLCPGHDRRGLGCGWYICSTKTTTAAAPRGSSCAAGLLREGLRPC
jgi:hypothetical protein